MKDFGRSLRLAARNRWSLIGIFLTSLMVAVLWGANIGTLYPLVEVVFNGQDLPEYAAEKIAEYEHVTAEIDAEVARLSAQLAGADPAQALATPAEVLRDVLDCLIPVQNALVRSKSG